MEMRPCHIYPGVSQYNGDSWLKPAMKLAYNTDYIHAWIGYSVFAGNKTVPYVYHSTAMGVHSVGWKTFMLERTIKHMWEVPLEPDLFYEFVTKCSNETGKKYSQRQLFGMAVAKLFNLNKLPFGKNNQSEHVCSETAGRMLIEYTDIDWGKKDPDLYTPKDFYDSCVILENMKLAEKKI